MGRSWIIAPALLLAAVPARGADRFDGSNLWSTERELVLTLSLMRQEKGIPGVVWCERMALALRRHAVLAIEAGYAGEGAPPASLGRCDPRARACHGWDAGEIFSNFGTASRTDYDPREQIERMLSNPDIRSYMDPARNVAACVLRPLGNGRVLVTLAVATADATKIGRETDAAGVLAARAFGGGPGERRDALRAMAGRPLHEAAPLYEALLAGKDAGARAAALRATGALADLAHVPLWCGLLGDPDPVIRETARDCLHAVTGKTDLPGDVEAWRAWWKTAGDGFKPAGTLRPDPPAPGEDGNGLATAGDPASALEAREAASLARKALSVKEPAVLWFCVRGIASARCGISASALLPLLDGAPLPVHGEVARALTTLAEKSHFPRLAASLRAASGRPVVLSDLYLALARSGDARAIPLLSSASLSEDNPAVACRCARSLGLFREARAVSALITVLGEAERVSNAVLASAARTTLKSLTGQSPGDAASDWAAWWSRSRGSFEFPE